MKFPCLPQILMIIFAVLTSRIAAQDTPPVFMSSNSAASAANDGAMKFGSMSTNTMMEVDSKDAIPADLILWINTNLKTTAFLSNWDVKSLNSWHMSVVSNPVSVFINHPSSILCVIDFQVNNNRIVIKPSWISANWCDKQYTEERKVKYSALCKLE